jgi:hypothetical protein
MKKKTTLVIDKQMLRLVFTDHQNFFDLAILSIFFKIFEFSKENKLYIFFKIKYQVIYNKIIFQKNDTQPIFSPWVELGSRSKADLEK